MSKAFKFVLNRKSVRELMKSEEMQGLLSKYATAIKTRCGDGFEQDIYVGKNRANAMIFADSRRARYKCRKENTLLKALR